MARQPVTVRHIITQLATCHTTGPPHHHRTLPRVMWLQRPASRAATWHPVGVPRGTLWVPLTIFFPILSKLQNVISFSYEVRLRNRTYRRIQRDETYVMEQVSKIFETVNFCLFSQSILIIPSHWRTFGPPKV